MKGLIGVVILQLGCFDLACLTRSSEPVYFQNIFEVSVVESLNALYASVCGIGKEFVYYDGASPVC